ncbi:MAG: molybdopterin biosynthesis protein [Deltaproteobacteria bacterium]|nr:molybdopterin biosynthesis protein [Deltaproteobacteria bacterium]
MARRTYLKKRSVSEAWALLAEAIGPRPTCVAETVRVDEALGRIAARPVTARDSSPAFPCAAMDGVAVRSADTEGTTESSPRTLRYGDQGVVVDTGDAIPEGFDSVVMIEDVHEVSPGRFEIPRAVTPWQHVRMAGEDVVEGDVVVARGRRIGPFEIGALLAVGRTEVDVVKRPVVGILPTGDELIAPGDAPRPGAVVEFNARMIAAMVSEWGGAPVCYAPVTDDEGRLETALWTMLGASDVVVVNAGSSAGRGDLTPTIVERLGRLLVHGIDLMPGKPTVVGVVGGKPVIGLPGYPVSTVVAAEALLRPLIVRFLGTVREERPRIQANLSRPCPSRSGLEEVVRVRLGDVDGKLIATPLPRGAGAISTLTRADALLRVPTLVEGYNEGAAVDVDRLRPLAEIRGRLVAIGSHDLALDIVDDLLREDDPVAGLSSSHVGSLAGLMAIAKGDAHLAGTHLIDPETGLYNTPYVRRIVGGVDVAMFELARRTQGLYVARGNPLGIKRLSDLVRPDVRYVNRQRGAGTRVLFDLRLREAGIAIDAIRGYGREEFTHLAVGMAVRSGVADAALGIKAVAAQLGIGFVPLESERYDVVVAARFLGDARVQRFLEVIRSAHFRARVRELVGYDPARSGEAIGVG